MKVLLVCSKYLPEYSGAGLRAHRTYQRLSSRDDVEFKVLCSSMLYFEYRNEKYRYEGIEVTRISSPWKKKYLKSKTKGCRFRRKLYYAMMALDESLRTFAYLVVNRKSFDRLHTFGHCWSAGIAAIWCGFFKKTIIREMVTMNSRPDDPPGIRVLVRWALQRCGYVVAISPLLAERAKKLGYQRIWCRPNPVNSKQFCVGSVSESQALRGTYTPFSPEDIILLELSKFSEVKNKEMLLEMIQLLPSKYKLLIAGPLDASGQAVYDRMMKRVQELSLEQRVVLLPGFVNHPEQFFCLSDVFLFASLSDGLGTPVLEALCCGIPVVANRLKGVTDTWIQHGVNGMLCDATPQSFAEGVIAAEHLSRETLSQRADTLRDQVNPESLDANYYRLLNISDEQVVA